jgi:hypothetical protein
MSSIIVIVPAVHAHVFNHQGSHRIVCRPQLVGESGGPVYPFACRGLFIPHTGHTCTFWAKHVDVGWVFRGSCPRAEKFGQELALNSGEGFRLGLLREGEDRGDGTSFLLKVKYFAEITCFAKYYSFLSCIR